MNDNYNTYDLGIAAALSVLGFELLDLDKSNPRKVQFIFKSDKRKGEIKEIAHQYFSDTLELPAQRLFNAIKMLKNRIYSDI